MPAITMKWVPSSTPSPLTFTMSMARSWPVSAMSMAARRNSGMSRLRASRLPVPAGMIPTGMPVPASSAQTSRTVPSPPQTSDQVGAGDGGRLRHAGAGVRDGRVVPDRQPPARLGGHRVHDLAELLDVLDLRRVEDDGEVAVGGVRRRQGRQQRGVAARQRAVDRQPERHHAHPEQEAADDVRGEVPAEQHPVEADDHDHEPDQRVEQPAHVAAAYQHHHEDDQDPAERRDRRRVPRRERLRREQRLVELPLRPRPADQHLDQRVRQRWSPP